MGVYFVLLVYSTSINELVYISRQSGPPEVTFKECFSTESASMAKGRGVV